MTFSTWTIVNFIFGGFLTFIISDPKFYNIPEDKVPDIIGRIGCYGEICSLLQGFVIGVIIDTFGRKIPLVFSQIETAVAIAAIPLFKTIYPGFFIARCLLSLGSSMALNMPLMPDYVEEKCVGLASAYMVVLMNLSCILSSSGLYEIASLIDNQMYIYFGIAAMIFVVAIYMVYGIKDVNFTS